MFLLVPAHPGFPGQIPQSRKTVVCVCVSIVVINCPLSASSVQYDPWHPMLFKSLLMYQENGFWLANRICSIDVGKHSIHLEFKYAQHWLLQEVCYMHSYHTCLYFDMFVALLHVFYTDLVVCWVGWHCCHCRCQYQ